jgi:hypothetical protein
MPRLASHHHLDRSFSEEEIRTTIAELPAEKAPGPDGFTGVFYKSCWGIIKNEVIATFHCIYNQVTGPLPKLNGALITLLPKKEASDAPSNFRSISLVHSFAKLITKVLARRLAPHMNDLISSAQSVFVKCRCIQDNFLYVRNLARAYHRKKIPAMLFKLDISKALDSVSWAYLLELLHHRGFPTRWRNWVSLLLMSSSSSV